MVFSTLSDRIFLLNDRVTNSIVRKISDITLYKLVHLRTSARVRASARVRVCVRVCVRVVVSQCAILCACNFVTDNGIRAAETSHVTRARRCL